MTTSWSLEISLAMRLKFSQSLHRPIQVLAVSANPLRVSLSMQARESTVSIHEKYLEILKQVKKRQWTLSQAA